MFDLLTKGIPLPFNLNLWPDWVPAGTVTLTLPPSGVGTSTAPPSAAKVIGIIASINRSAPSLLKRTCCSSCTNRYRSPLAAPRGPASPSPESLILVPSSTPAGIFTLIVFSLCVLPSPLQELQGSVITWPLPEQF